MSVPKECSIDTSLMEKDERLKTFVQTMRKFTGKKRHRNSFQRCDLFPNNSTCTEHSLTVTGAIQHLKLGQYFRHKYLTQSTLFDNKSTLTSQIDTFTTKRSRTYQSAIAFLYGFLTQSDFNLTNLNISPVDQFFCSREITGDKNCNCQYSQILDEIIFKSRARYFRRNKENNKHVLTSLNNSDYGTTYPFYSLIDVLYHAVCHDRPNLCSDNDNTTCIKEHFKRIWEKFIDETGYLVEHLKNTTYFYTALYPLMANIANRLKDHVKGQNLQRLVVYSGHDTALMSLLYMLEIDGSWIRYAGRIVLELYESEAHKYIDKYYIRILYNGQDVTQSVKFCKGKLFKGLCNFTLFYDFVFNEILQQFGYTSYSDVCAKET